MTLSVIMTPMLLYNLGSLKQLTLRIPLKYSNTGTFPALFIAPYTPVHQSNM